MSRSRVHHAPELLPGPMPAIAVGFLGSFGLAGLAFASGFGWLATLLGLSLGGSATMLLYAFALLMLDRPRPPAAPRLRLQRAYHG
jgi:hypothetical protein